jgi:hypothetical protein
MAEVGAYLTDHVLPHLPLRQWVLSLPKRLRPYLHHDSEVAGAVLKIFMRGLRSLLRTTSPGVPRDTHLAAVSFPQRFGGSLNPHFHFHVLAIDSVFSETSSREIRFHEAMLLTSEHGEKLARTTQRHVLRAFTRHGLLEEDAAADMLGWQAKRASAWTARCAWREDEPASNATGTGDWWRRQVSGSAGSSLLSITPAAGSRRRVCKAFLPVGARDNGKEPYEKCWWFPTSRTRPAP